MIKKTLVTLISLFISAVFVLLVEGCPISASTSSSSSSSLPWPASTSWSNVQTSNVVQYLTASNVNGSQYQNNIYVVKSTNTASLIPDDGSSMITVTVNPSIGYQYITGFGGSFTEAAASVIYGAESVNGNMSGQQLLPTSEIQSIISMYFDTNTGSGYDFCRTHIGSCDFSEYSYCYDNTPGDTNLANFTVATDVLLNMIRFITDAQAAAGGPGSIFIFACPWEPCPWMTTLGSITNFDVPNNQPGLYCLNTPVYANYLVKYIKAYASYGITINMLGVQNEPYNGSGGWESCQWTPQEQGQFIANYIGPAIANAGLSTKIMIYDHNKGGNDPYVAGNDPLAWETGVLSASGGSSQYVWSVGIHWYDNINDDFGQYQTIYTNVSNAYVTYPNIKIFATEACFERPLPVLHGSYYLAECYGNDIINDVNNFSCGWADWNMVLNDYGYPNHALNVCSCPININSSGQIFTNPAYFYISHFSKYLRPGYERISVTPSVTNLQVTAAIGSNNQIAVVVLNRSTSDQPFKLKIGNLISKFDEPANSISTILLK